MGASLPPPPDAVVVDLDAFRIGNDPVLVFDAESYALIEANELSRDLFGIDSANPTGLGIELLASDTAPFDFESLHSEVRRAIHLGSHRFSWRTLDAKKRQVFLELTIRVVRIGGEPRLLVVAQDQTEKIALLEALERTTSVLRNAVSRSPVAIVLFDAPDGRIRLTNRAAEVMRADSSRFTESALDAFRFAEREGDTIPPESHPFRRVLHGESLENAQLSVVADGRRRSVLLHAAPILSSHGEIISAVAIIPDVTDVVRAESALRERDMFMRRFFEHAREVLFVVDAKGTVVSVSPSVREVLGHSPADLVGGRLGSSVLLDPSEATRAKQDLERIIAGDYLETTDYAFFTSDGRRRIGEVSGSPIEDKDGEPTAIFVMRDVTEQRLADERRAVMETALRRRQRLETIGSLASGIAHEINNPLTGILNLAEMLELDIVPANEAGRTGTRIRALCERMATIVAELMALARTEPDQVAPVDMAALVQSALDLIRPQLRRARIVTELVQDPALPRVPGRSQPLVQTVLNILTNACEALTDVAPEAPRRILVEVHAVRVEGHEVVRLSIEDSGPGVDSSLGNSIFEPLVTTKEQRIGAGLGLWVSRGIATEHGGRIWYEDVVPHGARFHVELPVEPQFGQPEPTSERPSR